MNWGGENICFPGALQVRHWQAKITGREVSDLNIASSVISFFKQTFPKQLVSLSFMNLKNLFRSPTQGNLRKKCLTGVVQ